MAERDTSRYHFIKDRKVVHRGITDDLERREEEHQEALGGGHITPIGPKVTRASALEWEKKGGKRLPRKS
jgi:predicted GIY-YIG superfamily endonuclease